MKTRLSILCVILALTMTAQNTVPIKLTVNSSLLSTSSEIDPNLNPDWDWNKGDVTLNGVNRYVIYFQERPAPNEEWTYSPPWNQGDFWSGLSDRYKEDGWILLARDFGAPGRRIATNGKVYFILYNRYRSVARIFVLITKAMIKQNFEYATMEVTWNNITKVTGSLNYLSKYSEALDNIDKTKNNSTLSILTADPTQDNWVYFDIPFAFDNSYKAEKTDTPPSLKINLKGVTDTKLQLKLDGFSAQGDAQFIKQYMAGSNKGSINMSMKDFNLPELDIPFNLGSVDISATQKDWGGMMNYFKGVELNIPKLPITNPWKGMFDNFSMGLKDLSQSLPITIAGIDIIGLYNFFSGGGMKMNYVQTAPTYTSSQFVGEGTLTSKSNLGTYTIPMPATRTNYKDSYGGGEIGLVNNDPVGLVSLLKTPVVYKKTFQKVIGLGNPSFSPTFIEYELSDKLEIAFNIKSQLKLLTCEVSLVSPYLQKAHMPGQLSPYDIGKELLIVDYMTRTSTKVTNQRTLMEFDSPIKTSGGYFRSLPVPIKYSKGRTLQIPANNELSDLKLRVKAIFKRIDDDKAQPVITIATYNVEILEKSGLPVNQILPTIPPQGVMVSTPGIGGLKISWDRNKEKNIVFYRVERSINGSSFIPIGYTPDTVLTDSEIEKSVKAFMGSRQNVSVAYRLAAVAEWKDDFGSTIVQNSDYSDIAYAQGSVSTELSKRSHSIFIPESDFLSQNFPNPFNPKTTIYYGVKEAAHVQIEIFNALGQRVMELINADKEAGFYYTEWDAVTKPSGMYFYKITIGERSEMRKMLLMK